MTDLLPVRGSPGSPYTRKTPTAVKHCWLDGPGTDKGRVAR
jgi:hypothetical protein